MAGKVDSFQFMIENRKIITEVIRKTSTFSQAWRTLSEKLPEIGGEIKFNTFKAYARFLNVMDSELDKKVQIGQEKEILEVELGKVRQEKEVLEIELGKVRQELLNHEELSGVSEKRSASAVPKHVNGWGVQLKGNYYRLFKKIGGKVKWIHIGKEWNTNLARKKIKAFTG